MRILVTGATGFIGGRFARFALERGLSVRVNGRRPEAVEHLLVRGAEFVPGDLADPALVQRLCEGIEAVVHCAGAVGVWGSREHFQAANVGLLENVIEACMKRKVRRLVHLSSPSIQFDGRDHLNLGEDQVPRRFSDHYGATKYQAEQLLLSALDLGLEVLAVRPRFVVGAGDTSIFPRLIQAHRKGYLRMLGNGLNRVDFTSVHNLNDALFSCLLAGAPALGKVYNISNGQPVPFWDAVNFVMRRLDLPPVRGRLPYALGHVLALLNESVCRVLPGRPEPMLFRLGVAVMAKHFTLDITRAREYLDYEPRVGLWMALDEFCAWWRAQGL